MVRLWNQEQLQDLLARRRDASGPDTQFAHRFNFFDDIPDKNATIEYDMDFLNLIPDQRYVKIGAYFMWGVALQLRVDLKNDLRAKCSTGVCTSRKHHTASA